MKQAVPIFTVLLALLSTAASATSFTSFSVTRQIEYARYVVFGRIGSREVRLAPETGQPYTYWKLKIQDVYSDEKLSGTIEIRSPGGQIDGKGYNVAGAANFSENEQVVVMLRDTSEDAKQIIGLASGKYKLTKDDQGNEILKSGLGMVLKDNSGKIINLSGFRDLASRVLTHDVSPEERKILVNPGALPTGVDKSLNQHTKHNLREAIRSKVEESRQQLTAEMEVKKAPDVSDRTVASQTENQWIGPLIALVSFILAAFATVFVLKPKD